MKYLFSTLVRKKHVKITFYNEFTLNYYFIMKPGDCALVQWNIETLTTHLLVFSSEEKERQLPQQLTSLEGNGHCLLPVSSVVEMVTHPQLAGPLLVADLRLLVPALHRTSPVGSIVEPDPTFLPVARKRSGSSSSSYLR